MSKYAPTTINVPRIVLFCLFSREALFRQLCALFWFLEAMNSDPSIMGPVSLSWNLRWSIFLEAS